MSVRQDHTSWNPYDLFTDEHRSLLETTTKIDAAMSRIKEMAFSLAYNGPLPNQEVQWLIHLAYCALGEVRSEVHHEEYTAGSRQEQSQLTSSIPIEPIEPPPYEPVALPAWLLALGQQEGGSL